MKYFTIQGERCSGTHFIQYALTFNFHIEYKILLNEKHLNEKHFFGFNENIYNEENSNNIIFFYVVRDPVEWIDSFFKRLHHVPAENKKSIENFINNEFYSIYEEGPKNKEEIMEDRNIVTKERYKNIFELRKIKNDYMLNHVKNKVKYFYLLRYEDLRDNYEATLEKIKTTFGLVQKQNQYVPVPKYKGTYKVDYYKKPILLNHEIQYKIKQSVDLQQEQELGYLL